VTEAARDTDVFFPRKGNKKDNVTVIYTPWSNLKKDGSMAVGQVGFKDPRKVGFPEFCFMRGARLRSYPGQENPRCSERESYCQSSE
jgi:hypothetical protein